MASLGIKIGVSGACSSTTSPRKQILGSIAMLSALFVSDLHGRIERYQALFATIEKEMPSFVFLGGDLLPFRDEDSFIQDCLVASFRNLREALRDRYPNVYLILGNDDPGATVPSFVEGDSLGLWHYVHNRKVTMGQLTVYGYCCVPPTPFRLKDWERYDVSRYCEPGCISPEEGVRSVSAEESDSKWGTIERDLLALTESDDPRNAVFLFHAPPYDTCLDRAALDSKFVDHAPLDLHIGSIAIRRFIEARQPLVSLHGHVHEAARLTGEWKTKIGRTVCLGAAHDGPELALVRFDLSAPDHATRELLGFSYSASGVYGQDR